MFFMWLKVEVREKLKVDGDWMRVSVIKCMCNICVK